MKKKIKKEYIKTNLIGFIIAGIIVSGVVVCAAVTFPSNEVSYSNTESGLNSTNVQGAIDELYETCTKEPTAGEQIIENAGLEKDQYECRYFFTGKSPNNFITFNNEKWRIISIECDGTIKIIRNAGIGSREWDTSNSNNWAISSSLNTYLNGTYLNGLTSTAQSQIVSKDWSIGGVPDNNNDLANQINSENGTKWNGKVALPTASEYIRSNGNQNNCGNMEQIKDVSRGCKKTTWMFKNSDLEFWTLTVSSSYNQFVYFIDMDGILDTFYGYSTFVNVRPVVYLSSKIKITGGTGTQNAPFTISL